MKILSNNKIFSKITIFLLLVVITPLELLFADSSSCQSSATVNFSSNNTSVQVVSTKDLSNVVLDFCGGLEKKFNLQGGKVWVFSGSETPIKGVWVKAGCEKSGDGPGYGVYYPNPSNTVCQTPTPTLTPTLTCTSSATATPTASSTATSTPSNTPTNTPTNTPEPTQIIEITYTATPTPDTTHTPTPSPSVTPMETPSATPTTLPSHTPTPTATQTPQKTIVICDIPGGVAPEGYSSAILEDQLPEYLSQGAATGECPRDCMGIPNG